MLSLNPSTRWLPALLLLGALSARPAAAADVAQFTNLGQADVDKVVKDFSANFTYSSVTPASSLGGLGGFEIGLVGGTTKDPDVVQLVKSTNSTSSIPSYLPHAALLARVGLPYGFTAEAMLFPNRTISSVSIKEYGGAVGWTLTDSALDDLPFNLMTKASLSHAQVGYTYNTTASTTYNGVTAGVTVPVAITYKDTEWQLQAMISKKLLIFEPYLSLGYVHSGGNFNVDANGAVVNVVNFGSFNLPSTTTSVSLDSNPTSFQLIAGTDIRLGFFSLGAEYQRSFGVNSITGRLSFRF